MSPQNREIHQNFPFFLRSNHRRCLPAHKFIILFRSSARTFSRKRQKLGYLVTQNVIRVFYTCLRFCPKKVLVLLNLFWWLNSNIPGNSRPKRGVFYKTGVSWRALALFILNQRRTKQSSEFVRPKHHSFKSKNFENYWRLENVNKVTKS